MIGKQKKLYSILCARHDGKELSDAELHALSAMLDGDEEAQCIYFQMERMFHDLEAAYLGNDAAELVDQLPARRSNVIPLFGWAAAIAASLLAVFMLYPKAGSTPSGLLVDSGSTVLIGEGGFVAHVVMNGGGILLRDKMPDPDFPPAGEHRHSRASPQQQRHRPARCLQPHRQPHRGTAARPGRTRPV